MRSNIRQGNLISLKDGYRHYPYPKAAFLVLVSELDDPYSPRASIKVLDKHATIINLPYSQLYMYEVTAEEQSFFLVLKQDQEWEPQFFTHVPCLKVLTPNGTIATFSIQMIDSYKTANTA